MHLNLSSVLSLQDSDGSTYNSFYYAFFAVRFMTTTPSSVLFRCTYIVKLMDGCIVSTFPCFARQFHKLQYFPKGSRRRRLRAASLYALQVAGGIYRNQNSTYNGEFDTSPTQKGVHVVGIRSYNHTIETYIYARPASMRFLATCRLLRPTSAEDFSAVFSTSSLGATRIISTWQGWPW